MSSILSLLLETEGQTGEPNNWASYILMGVVVVILIGAMIIISRRNKKRQQEAEDLINAVKPGNKVKTIGGVCGIVVEVDDEENTFVLETGSETSGKCYMKFDRQAILQSDAVVEKKDDSKKSKDEKEEDKQTETTEEATEEKSEAPAEETKEN